MCIRDRLRFESRLPNPESGILVRIWIFSGFYFFTNAQVSEFSLGGWHLKGKVKRIWVWNHFSQAPNPLSLPLCTPATQASVSLNARIFLKLILSKYTTYHSPHGWHLIDQVYGSGCSGNHSRYCKQVDTGINHLIQQKLLLEELQLTCTGERYYKETWSICQHDTKSKVVLIVKSSFYSFQQREIMLFHIISCQLT